MNDRDRLIDAYLDGTLAPEEEVPLQTLLRNDAEARSALRRRAAIDEHLSDLAQVVPIPSTESDPKTIPFPTRWATVLPWALAALLMVALLIDRIPGTTINDSESANFVGLLVNEADAQFAPNQGPDDVRFDAGDYRLTQGIVHMRFENGADVIMQAPTAFRIDDSFHLALKDGGLRAIIPPSAQGFTVATPGMDYEDLGTEFGVSVNQDSGNSQLHVFDGQVDAKLPTTSQLLSSILAGETVEHVDGELRSTDTPARDSYPQPGDIGFLRWQSWKEEILGDPSLLALYTFTRIPEAPETLKNQIDGSPVSDGAIHQARWVSGRWPGKQALLFDRSSNQDSVELHLPGEFDGLTLSTWIKVNRLDHELTSILDSNGWSEGGLHFQINRLGHIRNGFFSLKKHRQTPSPIPIELGKWRHVVSVVSQSEGSSKIFINGQLASQSGIAKSGSLAPGTCRLGNWLHRPDWDQSPVRAFKGRIDELAIWNRALTEDEIQAHYEAGRPNLIDE